EPPLLTGPPPLCSGQTGTINITNSNLYNGFDWSTGESSSSITVNAPGTYTVTVSNGTGCTASGSITVDQNAGPQGTAVPTATTCGESNGSIDLSVSPPSSYAYVWSNGMNSEDISNVTAGVYSVTITDLSGCTSVVSSTIPDQPIILTITDVILPNTSCSQFNGSINISISPSGNYSYLWSNGAVTEDIANLAPGTYSVTVTKGVNCTATGIYTITDQSNAVNIASTIVPSTCGQSNGSIVIQLTGGTAPFSILWSNGNTTEQLSNINSGTYQVTVTGADGCTSTASVDVPDEIIPIDITALVTSNTSCTNSNGAIDISVTPVENYSYAWSTGATSEDLFNIGSGNYTVTVSFGNTCVQTADFTVINENIPFSLSGL
ncbi:MAG TPA: hypothetical protein VJ508_04210, partial [Saprospiraceae bacterium]|nr:hypothetical protein [Saprospiraceae bacterium]